MSDEHEWQDDDRPKKSLALVQVRAVGFLEQVRAGAMDRFKREDWLKHCAEVVFAYWAAKLGHPEALLDRKRETRIMARLRENNGNWGELCYAVDGALKDDWLMGRDERSRRRYDGIETIFRDREQIERLARECRGYRDGKLHPLVVKYQAEP